MRNAIVPADLVGVTLVAESRAWGQAPRYSLRLRKLPRLGRPIGDGRFRSSVAHRGLVIDPRRGLRSHPEDVSRGQQASLYPYTGSARSDCVANRKLRASHLQMALTHAETLRTGSSTAALTAGRSPVRGADRHG
jgi:hypothetical protein